MDAIPIVIDVGTDTFKAGFADSSGRPSYVFPPYVGHDDAFSIDRDFVVGQSALQSRTRTRPIERGQFRRIDDLSAIVEHVCVNKLGVRTNDQPVMFAEPTIRNASEREKNREQVAALLLESFNAPGLYIAPQDALSLFSVGITDGLVVASGHETTRTVPVKRGCVVYHAVCQEDLGGKDLTANLVSLFMTNRTRNLSEDQARFVKEKLCEFALDADKGTSNMDKTCNIPTEHGSQPITVGNEIYQCPEALFHYHSSGSARSVKGIHEMAIQSVVRCDLDMHEKLLNTVVPAGGTTLLKNFDIKFQQELQNQVDTARKGYEVTVLDPPERIFSSWLGGAIMVSQPSFKDMWITNQEYQEQGDRILRLKCF